MKPKNFSLVLGIFALLGLTGCELGLVNMTPGRLPQNPSALYTFSVHAKVSETNILPETFKAYLVINGETHLMKGDIRTNPIFELDYPITPSQNEVKYYYCMNYRSKVNGNICEKETKSPVYHLSIANRYISSLEVNRGPVGATIAIMGRGFSADDKVLLGAVEVPTHFLSANTLHFTVPSLPAGHSYPVSVSEGTAVLKVGLFTIDAMMLQISKHAIELNTHEHTSMTITIPHPAPTGGIPVIITTDVPDSAIIPELSIPEGSRTISIPIEGGTPGRGHLFFEAPGFKEAKASIIVR